MYKGVVPNTHTRGSAQIDFPLITAGLEKHVLDVGLLDRSVLQIERSCMFVDLRIEGIFGQNPDKLAPYQFRNIKLDDPRISDKYRNISHKQFEQQNVYRRVKKISVRGKDGRWNIMDETIYEKLDADILEAMKHAERMCNLHKAHATPWAKSLCQETHTIMYWDARIARRGTLEYDDEVIYYYLSRSNIDKERFAVTLSITACIHQLNNTRRQLKDVIKEAANNGAFYEVEVATARVEKKFPHFSEDNVACAIQREEKIELEVKAQENRRNTHGSFRKLGIQIRGHVKPNSNKKSSLTRVSVPDDGPEGLCQHIIGKDNLEEHLIKRNVEQFLHAGATPFGYTELGKDLGHTDDSQMAQDICDGTLEHNALSDGAMHVIVAQLRKHPAIDKILKPVVSPEDFKSAFKCVPEKTASSLSGRGAHHYKACTEGSDDSLADIQVEVHASMMTVPLDAGFYPERWKQTVDVIRKSARMRTCARGCARCRFIE
jgi:hypothetical protein